MKKNLVILPLLLVLSCCSYASGQGGRGAPANSSRHIVYGDIKVDQAQAGMDKPLSLDFTLFNEYGNAISKQRVQTNGRYRFIDIPDGRYYIVIEYEGTELDRFTVDFSSQFKSDMQKDIELQARAVSEATKA